MQPPVFDIDPASFGDDPYPVYANMRREAPICFVPQLGAILLTRRDDIFVCEKNVAVFSSDQPQGLMTRLMGQNMMRKDGEAHMAERRVFFPAVSPRAVANRWIERFRQIVAAALDEIAPRGGCDLIADYAMPVAGEALKSLTGLNDVSWRDIDAWSQAMIDGIANYGGDKGIEARCRAATAAIDAAIDARLARPPVADGSLIAAMAAGGMPAEALRANIRLAISGGQNEPRDAIGGCVHALLAHPGAFDAVRSGEAPWLQAFEEYCRWTAPIGMSPRRVAQSHEFGGVEFAPEARVFLMFGSGNRDESVFAQPDRFDIRRDCAKSIAFGAGPHFCAGAYASRALVAEAALPLLFERLKNLRLAQGENPQYQGWAFRSLRRLRVEWDA